VPSERTTRIVVAGSLLVALMVGNEILTLIRRNITARDGKEAIERLRHALLLKLHNVPVEYHRRSEPAELHDDIVVHTATIDTMVQSVLSTVLPTFILLAGIAGVMLSINWIVFIETLLVIPSSMPSTESFNLWYSKPKTTTTQSSVASATA
jgi:ABC-type bacteriocin/lantibiotic exporter with double-glycine peptidase domain